jgi:hypothetical protein
MESVPHQFQNEFDQKGDTFFQLAELLYTNHGHQYTLDELANAVGVSDSRVSELIDEMAKDDDAWVNKSTEQMTIVWNTEKHNPASTETTHAVRDFYRDLWELLKMHSRTAPGTFAIFGFLLFAAAVVLTSFYVGSTLSPENSGFPVITYLVLAIVSFITGVITTVLAPVQAFVNSLLRSRLPSNIFSDSN